VAGPVSSAGCVIMHPAFMPGFGLGGRTRTRGERCPYGAGPNSHAARETHTHTHLEDGERQKAPQPAPALSRSPKPPARPAPFPVAVQPTCPCRLPAHATLPLTIGTHHAHHCTRSNSNPSLKKTKGCHELHLEKEERKKIVQQRASTWPCLTCRATRRRPLAGRPLTCRASGGGQWWTTATPPRPRR